MWKVLKTMWTITPPWILRIVAACSIMGAGIALFATNQTIRIQKIGLENPSSCVVNAWINCDAAQASSYALMVGVPVAWWGFLYYVWIGITVVWAAFKKEKGRAAASAAFVFSLMALIFTFYKAYILVLVLKVLCPVCVIMYVVNIAIALFLGRYLGLSFREMPGFLKGYFRLAFGRPADLNFSPRAALYFTSAAVLFSVGLGSMKRVEAHALKLPELNVAEEVTNHFLQPRNIIEIDSFVPVWGNPQGSVTIVEFSDFQCPSCRFAAFHLRSVLWEFRNHVRFYFMNFPLDNKINPYVNLGIHKQAGLAARAAVCAQQRGGFWEYHDEIFRNQQELNRELLLSLATKRGWNSEDFAVCMDSDESFQRVRTDIEYAHRANVKATPTLFINGRYVKYWYHPEILRATIREELRRSTQNNSVFSNKR